MKKELKGNIKTLVLCVAAILLFSVLVIVFEPKTNSIKNQKIEITLSERPRLEDDFYEYINYEELSQLHIDDNKINDYYDYYSKANKIIQEEKKDLINKLLSNCSTYSKGSTYDKMCKYYEILNNANYEDNKKEIDNQIEKIKSVSTIEDYLKVIAELNNKYRAEILFNIELSILNDNNKEYLNEIGGIPFAIENDDDSSYYGFAYNILINYGFDSKEVEKILSNAAKINETLTKYTKSAVREKQDIYTLDELKDKYKNINFDLISDEFILKGKRIELLNEPQIRELNKYLVNDNLDILKDYAILALVNSQATLLSEKNYEAIHSLNTELRDKKEEFKKEDIIYDELYEYFGDTISYEYSKTFMNEEEKNFFKGIISEYMNAYRKRLESENWLQESTKTSALKKLDNMNFEVAYIDLKNSKENNYKLVGNSQLEVISGVKKTYNRMFFESAVDDTNFFKFNDWLEVNAFYDPTSNAFIIEQGILKAYSVNFDITKENYKEKYYEILGLVGLTVGHEMGHAFDNTGSKYDEVGRKINWWTNEDKLEYSKKTYYVDKLYEQYHQKGHETLGENVADLTGMSITMQIAEEHNATNEDYKKIFEHYAKDFMTQNTPFFQAYLLFNDEHSPGKNRVNVVLSNTDKFYEVYNIKETDKMYIPVDKRVKVW